MATEIRKTLKHPVFCFAMEQFAQWDVNVFEFSKDRVHPQPSRKSRVVLGTKLGRPPFVGGTVALTEGPVTWYVRFRWATSITGRCTRRRWEISTRWKP
ncbi:MAG: hypothetical protein ABL921_17800 [Pirellula sp.]